MGFVGKKPTRVALSSDDITDGIIVNADINSSAAIAISKTALSAGTGISLSTNTLNVDAAQTGITSLLATDIKIGEDDQTKIDFEDNNKINFYANNVKEVELAENSLSPGSSDGTALGTTSLMWSDLFLASGGVINLNDGDVTITHASGKLTSTGDLELLRDANDADVKVTLGTSAAESLIIQVLNGGSNKTAEEVHFSTATASGTADHGKMVFDIDGTDILTIDDGGLVIKTTGTIGPVGDEDLITLTASGNIVTVAGELSVTTLDIGGTNITSTAAELNILDGVNTTASELNLLDGSAKSTSSITLADADAFIVIDGTTTKQIPASDLSTYIGSGGSSFDAVADGAISAGDLVALESDGKIKTAAPLQAGADFNSFSSPGGTRIEPGGGNSIYTSVGFDPDNNKIAVGYRDGGNSSYATLALGHITSAANHTLSFGTPVVAESAAMTLQPAREIIYDTNVDRFLWVYTTSSGIRSVTFTVDDAASNTITKGSAQSIDNSQRFAAVCFDSTHNKVIIVFEDTDNSNQLYMTAVSVRGSSDNDVNLPVTNTQLYAHDVSGDNGVGICFDDNDERAMVVYRDTQNSNYPYAVSISFDPDGGGNGTLTAGTAVQLNNTQIQSSQPVSVIHDPVKNINLMASQGYSGGLETIPFTSASGSITAGTQAVYNENNLPADMQYGQYIHGHYNPDEAKIVIFNGYSGVVVSVGEISGTGSSAEFVVSSVAMIAPENGDTGGGYINYLSACYDTNSNKSFIAFNPQTGTLGTIGILPVVPNNAGNFIGIANSAISDGATGTVTTTGGIGTGQSSLTIGSHYYVTDGGALTTTSGTVHAGKALTASTILINAPRI